MHSPTRLSASHARYTDVSGRERLSDPSMEQAALIDESHFASEA